MPVTIDTTGADRKLAELARQLDPKALQKILKRAAFRLLRDMRIRVESKGIGSSGKPMRLYSPSYAQKRAKAGRTTDKRTLSFSSVMLGARKVTTSGAGKVRIGWAPGKQAEKALSNELRTPWTQPTKKENAGLIKFVRREIKAAAAKANRSG